jgi:hypothetical protein
VSKRCCKGVPSEAISEGTHKSPATLIWILVRTFTELDIAFKQHCHFTSQFSMFFLKERPV